MQTKRKPYPNDHTAIVGMVDEHGFAEVVRALADQARRRAICHGESQRQAHQDISYLLDDCANAIEAIYAQRSAAPSNDTPELSQAGPLTGSAA